jgi:hypothetical protein
VALRESREGIFVEVSVGSNAAKPSRAQVLAPTCDEALEAAVAIAALALSSESPAQQRSAQQRNAREGNAQQRPAASEPGARASESTGGNSVSPIADVHLQTQQASASPETWAAHWAAGANVGSLPTVTAVLTAGLSAELAGGALRTLITYGVPTTQEEVTQGLERTRWDFAAFGAAYCRRLNGLQWLSTCAGMNASLARARRTSVPVNEARTEQRHLHPTLSAEVQVIFATQRDGWHPELELTAGVPLAGSSRQSPVSGRGTVGIGIDL